MIKLPKKIAFIILVIVTVLLAITINSINFESLNNAENFSQIFKQIKEPLAFLILTIFYLIYYVDVIKKEKK